MNELWFRTFSPVVVEILMGLAVIMLGLITAWIKQKTGIDVQAKHRETLHSAIITGINLGVSKAGKAMGVPTSTTSSVVTKEAVAYVARGAPDAVKHFGLDGKRVEDMVRAKMQQVLGGTAPVVAPPS